MESEILSMLSGGADAATLAMVWVLVKMHIKSELHDARLARLENEKNS